MMSRRRADIVLSNSTNAAKKVYEVVPIEAIWTLTQIIAELQRMKVGIEYQAVGGCLNTLVNSKLVDEPRPGHFRRAPIREPITKAVEPKQEPIMQPNIPLPASSPAPFDGLSTILDPMERIGALSADIAKLNDLIRVRTQQVNDAVIELQTKAEADADALETAREFQAVIDKMNRAKAK